MSDPPIPFREIVEQQTDLVFVFDARGRMQYANRAFEDLLGYTPEQTEALTVEALVAPPFREEARARIRHHMEGEPVEQPWDLQVLDARGAAVWVQTRTHPSRDGDGRLVMLHGIARDLRARKALEERLHAALRQAERAVAERTEELGERERRHQQMADLLPVMVWEMDLTGRFTYANRTGFESFGLTEGDLARGVTALDLIDPANHLHALEKMRGLVQGEPESFSEYTARRADGSTFPALVRSSVVRQDGQPVGFCGVIIDISERKQLERQFHEAQKMQAIGTLAGGVAHDFNNVLMGILGHASLMRADLGAGHPHDPSLEAIEELVQRAADLTRQLLGFARGGKYEVRPWDPGRILSETVEMFGRTRKELKIERSVVAGLPPVRVDRGQLEQVLMNVLINAWQAMPGGGTLVIAARAVEVDAVRAAGAAVAAGRYVQLSVADDGCGMTPEVRARAFEPFFTTRQPGEGSGLGLASAYGIVRNHDGFLTIDSEPGRGTAVAIHLPAAAGEVTREPIREAVPERGEGGVLVVDDEDDIRGVTRELLDSLGYRTLEARTGAEAVARLQDERGAIDLVLLDLTMPGIGGLEVFEQLRALAPDLPVVLCSGYGLDDATAALLDEGPTAFLQKPYGIHALSKQIRALLDRC